MKRLNYNFLFGAIALTGAFAFTSCSSSEDETSAEGNPTVEGKSVKTQFAITIGNIGDNSTKSRMTESNTQASTSATFLGMNRMRLMSLALTSNNTYVKTATGSAIKSVTDLGSLVTNDLDNGRKIFYDIEIPDKTNNFLFYGSGPQNTLNTTPYENKYENKAYESYYKEMMQHGCVNASYPDVSTTSSATTSDISFSLESIVEPTDVDDSQMDYLYKWSDTKKKKLLKQIAEKIINASIDEKVEDKTYTITWAGLNYQFTLGKLFYEFIGAILTDEQKKETSPNATTFNPLAGSSVAIKGAISDLYVKLNNAKSDPTVLKGGSLTVGENNTVTIKTTRGQMATKIMEIIDGLKATTENSANAHTLFKKVYNAKNELTGLDWNSDTSFDCDPKFPTNLPNGATQYQWGKTTEGKYTASYNVQNIGSGNNIIPVSSLVYPACLFYSCDSPVEASTVALESTNWPSNASDWQSDTGSYWSSNNTYNWTSVVDASKTQTVALRNNANYGVANLAVAVRYDTENNNHLKDNEGADITLADDGMKVTGILVGGQSKTVDWQFLPTSNASVVTVYADVTDESIYAHNSKATGVTNNGYSNTTYVLLFDNYETTTSSNTGQKDVKIAIEFENNTGKEFEGHDGRVTTGQKFYLLGDLKVDEGTETVTFPSEPIRYPATNTKRVFMQDYTTTAYLTVESLKNAYVNIPDLRTTQMRLGLSVNLVWQYGLTFGSSDKPIKIGADDTTTTNTGSGNS